MRMKQLGLIALKGTVQTLCLGLAVGLRVALERQADVKNTTASKASHSAARSSGATAVACTIG